MNTIPSEAVQHAERACESERLFLSGMLDDPVLGWNCATDAALDHESFIDVRHSRLFDVLAHCALQDIQPTPWLIGELMTKLGVPFIDDELLALWHLEPPTGLDVAARQVAFYSQRRRQGHTLFQELRDVLTDLAMDARDLAPDRLEVAA